MDETEDDSDCKVDVLEMLQLQLSEVEMLQSMFPGDNELKLDDVTALEDIQRFVDGKFKYEYLHSRLGFTITIAVEDCKESVELVCQLPHEYPSIAPVVFTRSSNMSRSNHRKLNEDLQNFVVSIEHGEICLYSIIEWLQENIHTYSLDDSVNEKSEKLKVEEDTIFTRLWIYSHHIYSKFKRRDIIDWAEELKLTGFSLPGKPGVVCVEGYSRPVDEYWHRLRRLNWKRLVIKEKEEKDIQNDDLSKHRKFENFEEKAFDARGGKGREYHMDLGLLYDYLEKHQSGHIFQMYFGVQGKNSTS
ncbi:RWD domain-containing protein 2B [Mactra antiquata]